MDNNAAEVVVCGDIVDFTYCKLQNRLLWKSSQEALDIKHTLGNDAAILSCVLASLGNKVHFVMQSSADASLIEKVKGAGVQFWHILEGSSGQTIMLEDAEGSRTFITKYGSGAGRIPGLKSGDLLYLDFYDERYSFITEFLNCSRERKQKQIFINLSSDNMIEKAECLSSFRERIDYVQFSCRRKEADSVFDRMHKLLRDSVLIGTFAEEGAGMLAFGEKRYLEVPYKNEGKNIVGAGAFFSAFFIDDICRHISPADAFQNAAEKTSRLCLDSGAVLMEDFSVIPVIERLDGAGLKR